MLLRFDPWDFSEVYSHKTVRKKRIVSLVSDITNLFKSFRKQIQLDIKELAHNLIVKLSIDEVSPYVEAPNRHGVILPPTLTGYAPEGMFLNLVKNRLNSKIAKKQTHSISNCQCRALFVDVSNLGYITEFENPYYQKNFANSLIDNLDKNETYIDIIIFFQPARKEDSTIDILIVFKQKHISLSRMKDVVGIDTRFEEINKKVFIPG